MKSSWITLEEARDLSYGKTEWWKCKGANGEQVLERQQDPNGPPNRPVRLYGNGAMYIGGWKSRKWHGFGVQYRQDGYIRVWNFDEGKFFGPGMLLWLPTSPSWIRNQWNDSVIQTKPSLGRDGRPQEGVGLPFIYIGQYRKGSNIDHSARVILKDGTTRIGPWKDGAPVGDWWGQHGTSSTSQEEIARLLAPLAQRAAILVQASFANRSPSNAPTFRKEDAFKRQASVLSQGAIPNQASFSKQDSFRKFPTSSNRALLQQDSFAKQGPGGLTRHSSAMQLQSNSEHSSPRKAKPIGMMRQSSMRLPSAAFRGLDSAAIQNNNERSSPRRSKSDGMTRQISSRGLESVPSSRAIQNNNERSSPRRSKSGGMMRQVPSALSRGLGSVSSSAAIQKSSEHSSPRKSGSNALTRHASAMHLTSGDFGSNPSSPELQSASEHASPRKSKFSALTRHSSAKQLSSGELGAHPRELPSAGMRQSSMHLQSRERNSFASSTVLNHVDEGSTPRSPPRRTLSMPLSPRHFPGPQTPRKSNLTYNTDPPVSISQVVQRDQVPKIDLLSSSQHSTRRTPVGSPDQASLQLDRSTYHGASSPTKDRRARTSKGPSKYKRQQPSSDSRKNQETLAGMEYRRSSLFSAERRKFLDDQNSDGDESPTTVLIMQNNRKGLQTSTHSQRQQVLNRHSTDKSSYPYSDRLGNSAHSNQSDDDSFAGASDDGVVTPASVVLLKNSGYPSDLEDGSSHSQQGGQKSSFANSSLLDRMPSSRNKGVSRGGNPRSKDRAEQDQISRIANWLRDDVIGCDVSMDEMHQYAENFVHEGFHTIDVIQETVVAKDLHFMKKGHKRLFLARAFKHDRGMRRHQLTLISDWLADVVIGYGADQVEMDAYAQKLLDEGFHSVEMIQDVCTKDDIAGWMKKVHLRLFLSRAELKNL